MSLLRSNKCLKCDEGYDDCTEDKKVNNEREEDVE